MNNTLHKKTFYGQNQKQTAKCGLISQDRFAVELSNFNDEAIQIFKTVPSRSYGKFRFGQERIAKDKSLPISDPKTRNWSFHIKDYELVISKLRALQAKLHVEKIPGFVLNCLRMPQDETFIDYNKLDPALNSALMPFQMEGLRLEFLYKRSIL